MVLISLDALRADRLGCYGNPRRVSPNIDGLLSESVLFGNATSPTTWTLPGHISMLSGLEPPVHGCVSPRHRYAPQALPFPLIFELLRTAGYHPMAVTGGGYMEPSFGFGRGVKQYHIVYPILEGLKLALEHISAHDRTLSFFHTYAVHDYPRVISRPNALCYLEQRDPDYAGHFPRDQDFHPFLRAMAASPDAPTVHARDIAYISDLYDSAVNNADAALAGFFHELRQMDLWDETTLILTSDHGESLGETHCGRQYWSHAGPPYQEQLRVPLILRPAPSLGLSLEPGRIDQPVSLVDLVPTMLDLAELAYDRQQFDGSSLVDLCAGQVSAFETREMFFHSCEDTEDRYLDPRLFGTVLTWRNGQLHYDHRTGAIREYYHLDTDPTESSNSIDELDTDDLKRIDEAIAAYWNRMAQRAFSPESRVIDDPIVLERLRALGYIER